MDATDDNESLNNKTGQDNQAATNNNNGSSTPSTSAKQKKTFFNKKVSYLFEIKKLLSFVNSIQEP